jgi:hypothetical protein
MQGPTKGIADTERPGRSPATGYAASSQARIKTVEARAQRPRHLNARSARQCTVEQRPRAAKQEPFGPVSGERDA